MKMIDVLAKLARDEIKDGTELELHYLIGRTLKYTFYGKLKVFRDERFDGLDRWFSIDNSFLNLEVELIPPKPKKYLIKLNIKWLKSQLSYVIYYNDGPDQHVIIGNKVDNFGSKELGFYRAYFTEQDLQSIKPVKEFLDDMKGKYELVEVTNDENH